MKTLCLQEDEDTSVVSLWEPDPTHQRLFNLGAGGNIPRNSIVIPVVSAEIKKLLMAIILFFLHKFGNFNSVTHEI